MIWMSNYMLDVNLTGSFHFDVMNKISLVKIKTNTSFWHFVSQFTRISHKIFAFSFRNLPFCIFRILPITICHSLFEGMKSRCYQDLPGSIHEDTVMDGHRQGKKANGYKYPLTFLKWWSSLVLKHSLSLQRQFHPPTGSTPHKPC